MFPVKVLLSSKAKCNITDQVLFQTISPKYFLIPLQHITSPLHYASAGNRVDVLQLLLQAGAIVNVCDKVVSVFALSFGLVILC